MPQHALEAHSPAASAALPLLLVEEFSHRVVNEFSQAIAALRVTAKRTDCVEARSAMEAAAMRLTGYAEAHRALQKPRCAVDIDLAAYLADLCKTIAATSLRDRGVILSLAGDSVMIAADRGWRVALMVSELIANAARHGVGAGGAILVRLEHLGNVLSCHVIDNGGVAKHPIAARGLTVVGGLAAELGGTARWVFGKDGTRAEITIPLAEKDYPCANT